MMCILGRAFQVEGDDSTPTTKDQTDKERQRVAQERPQVLADILGKHAQAMFEEPTAEVVAASQIELISGDVRTAESESWIWIRRVIDANYTPKEDAAIHFIAAPSGVDMTRIAWDSGDFHFDVCQTRTAFTMKVTSSKETKNDLIPAARAATAKEICRAVFVDSCQVRMKGAIERMEYLKETLCSESFARGEFLELPGDKIVVIRRKRIIVANSPSDLDPIKYWYRQLGWWNDGKSTGFFLPKLTGPGGDEIDFSGRYDKGWFIRATKPN
jgi:hypothetical protein